jgi:murein DD-endopeptidase MepM/ murein hydrolase activator NlpD
MPRTSGPSRPVSGSRVAILALIAVGVAGCSDSGRFDIENPFASNQSPQARSDVTGSVSRPARTATVQSAPLPAPSRPQTVAAAQNGSGVSYGAGGMGAYRPPASVPGNNDITGSVNAPRPAAPAGHWTWEGGTPVTVGPNETVETIGRRHGVPVAAILQANNLSSPSQVRSGQRLVIPRYALDGAAPRTVAAAAPAHVAPPQPAPVAAQPRTVAANGAGTVHVVQSGETLMALSRRYGVSLSKIAHANNIPANTRVAIGDRITIPGTAYASAPRVAQAHQPQQTIRAPQQVAAAPAPQAPKLAKPQSAPVEKVASIAPQTANVAKAEEPAHETVTKSVEPAGAMPSFRWPVRGRVISGFGPKTSGQQNDGINIAVPEGTEVKAAEDGVVAYAGNELKGYGNLVLIRHANGYVSAYAHASELLVKRGDSIKRGQAIARAGQTGNVTSPQLHFEIRKGSTPVDPSRYLGGA